jgi:hypothetical protein
MELGVCEDVGVSSASLVERVFLAMFAATSFADQTPIGASGTCGSYTSLHLDPNRTIGKGGTSSNGCPRRVTAWYAFGLRLGELVVEPQE